MDMSGHGGSAGNVTTIGYHEAADVAAAYQYAQTLDDRVVLYGVSMGAAAILRAADRKSTRLNSSHANISYAVFCLKKKNKNTNNLAVGYVTLIDEILKTSISIRIFSLVVYYST